MGIILMLFIILILILSIPFVQIELGNYATKRLNKDFGTNISIDKVGLQFNGDIELKNIYVEDYKKETLISITELNTSILNFSNLYNGKLIFGDIDVIDLVFNITTYKGSRETNLDVFVAKFYDDNPRSERSSFLLSSSDVSIYNGVFNLSNENRENAKLLQFKDLNINVTNFLINGPDVSTRVNTLNFKDSRGLVMKNMMTDFKYTLTDMTFGNLNLRTSNSLLKGELKFLYDRKDLQFFTDKVLVKAKFNDSRVFLEELNTFYNEFGKNQFASFSANFAGTLNDLYANNLRLTTTANTRIYGDINLKNLFNKKGGNFYMYGSFSKLSSTYKDLKKLLPNGLGATIPTSFDRLGKFTIIGNSQVTSSNVIADIEMETELGFIDSDLKIDKINDIDNAKYRGEIILDHFDLGTFFNNSNVGFASLNFDVKGSGFTPENMDTQVKGDVLKIDYNDYTYKGLKVAGNLRNHIFDGNLIAIDENLKLNFNGLVDFSEELHKYDFEAKVDYANLKALNFVKKDSISIFKSSVKMNMNASNYDDAYGKFSFTNTSYSNEKETYYFNKFDVSSRFDKDIRFIEINSPDILKGDLKGRFRFKDLKKLFENSLGHIYTNYVPHKVEKNQSIDFNFKIYNKIIEVIYPEIELGKNTFIRGRVESDEKKFRLTFKSPEIKYLNNFVNNIELQVDNSNPLFNTLVELDSISTKHYNISKFNLINVTVNDTLFMRSEFNGGKRNSDNYNFSFYHTINDENESVIGFKKSDFTIKENKWHINEKKDNLNKITFNKSLALLKLNEFKVNHGKEEIRFSGFIKDSTQKDLKLNFKNVDLSKITPDIGSLSLSGNVNGTLDILQKKSNYLPNSTIVIDSFKVNDFLLGSFNADITGNESLTNYSINAKIKDDESKSFSAKGDINVVKEKEAIDLVLEFDKFNLALLGPLLEGVFSNIRGLASGDVRLSGDLNHPEINGKLKLNNSGLSIPYLNVDFDFNENALITLKDQTFFFNKLKLTDTKYKSKGELTGSLSHVNLSNWSLNLGLKTPRLLVLDTKETQESLYYGTGFLGGEATIKGPSEALLISVSGKTKKGTNFKIPLTDAESFGDNSYIKFITKKEKQARNKGEEIVFQEVEGLELDFDLDLTEDAEVEIIIDKKSGHALKGRGRGGLLVEINTNGKFNMWGDFSVFEGVYNFAYGGLVQKEFIVEPGGTIAWEGDPLDAVIRMNAIYKTQANPSPLLDNPINRSIPVELNIALTGNLEQFNPDFTFEFPNVNSAIKSELQYRLESEEDRGNQALYFLATGGAFQTRGFNDLSISGTIAERLNGIINSIFTDGNGKLNIGLNYEAGENRPEYQTSDRFGVTLQTQINDKVLINGKLGVPVGGANASETVVAGDVEISFLLNEDGTLSAKVFNRENSIRNFGEAIGYTQGVGLSHNVDFDTFKELIQNFFKKKNKTKNAEQKSDSQEQKPLPEFIKYKSTIKN